jgi:hypothetical protein
VTRAPKAGLAAFDLLNILDTIAKAGASFRSLGDGWADSTTPHGKLMLTVLGGLAEFERHLILAGRKSSRTGSGSEVRSEAQAHQASTSRSIGADCSGRDANGGSAKLQRQSRLVGVAVMQ